MYLDRAPKLTNLARGHLSVEARSEDPVDQSRSATGKKRPSKEVSTKKKETGRAGAITEGPKERAREEAEKDTGAQRGAARGSNAADCGPTPPPLWRHLRPRGRDLKGDGNGRRRDRAGVPGPLLGLKAARG